MENGALFAAQHVCRGRFYSSKIFLRKIGNIFLTNPVKKAKINIVLRTEYAVGVSPSGKAMDSDSIIRRFESCHPCHFVYRISNAGLFSFFAHPCQHLAVRNILTGFPFCVIRRIILPFYGNGEAAAPDQLLSGSDWG